MEENFDGISESANKSKGAKSYAEWDVYKGGTPEEIRVNEKFRKEMIEREKVLRVKIQEEINNMLCKGD